MINRIHILGGSGSGTTTLGNELSKRLMWPHFDTDNYFWLPTENPFTQKRNVSERFDLMRNDLVSHEKWILTGSLCGWGDIFIPYFDLVIFLWIPGEIRMERLKHREKERYGKEIDVGGKRYEESIKFLDWASQYDNGGMEIRSKVSHEKWISELKCPVFRIEGDIESTVADRVDKVIEHLRQIDLEVRPNDFL
ncbi:AAA family ATPase [Paenibacillus puldeungensis]|uniref:AAA family ATPase n=1 Tax=Paenibacillus puldeungensis TaxID=696536 RepID=A0ABW3RWZ1_9BACL